MKATKKINEELLLELWQTAIFDDECFEVLENLVKELSNKSKKNEPINDTLISKEIFYALGTTRNRNLIQRDEQKKLKKTVVGFFGLSVGSHAATTWMMESRAETIKITDNDTISPSNLNRLSLGWNSLGRPKIETLQEKILEIHPFVNIVATNDVSKKAVMGLFDSTPKLSVVVDAIDDMEGKILLRKLAKDRKISLVSAADVGDNVVLDIERYDIEPMPKLFLGRIPNIETIDFISLSDLERKKMIIKLVGFEKNSEQMLDSLLSLGKTLGTWPQLGATASIAGGIIATTIKKIVLGEKIKSGRYYFSLDDILVQKFNSAKRQQVRVEKINQIKKKFKMS